MDLSINFSQQVFQVEGLGILVSPKTNGTPGGSPDLLLVMWSNNIFLSLWLLVFLDIGPSFLFKTVLGASIYHEANGFPLHMYGYPGLGEGC